MKIIMIALSIKIFVKCAKMDSNKKRQFDDNNTNSSKRISKKIKTFDLKCPNQFTPQLLLGSGKKNEIDGVHFDSYDRHFNNNPNTLKYDSYDEYSDEINENSDDHKFIDDDIIENNDENNNENNDENNDDDYYEFNDEGDFLSENEQNDDLLIASNNNASNNDD